MNMGTKRFIASLCASLLVAGFASAATLYATDVPGSNDNDWVNESYAIGAPNSQGSTNEIRTSSEVLWATDFDAFSLQEGRTITSVKVDVRCRYDAHDNSNGDNRVRLYLEGVPDNPSLLSPAWTQTDQSWGWRMGDGGWNITGLRTWTEAAVNNLRVGVRRRNNDDNEGTNICRIDAFRIVVTTSAVPVCDFDTEPFDFDEVDVMDEDDWDFTIWNEGGVPLTGTIQLNGGSGMFSCPLDGHSYTIDPEDWLDVNVVFHPTEVGEFSCTLDAGIECGSVDISGTGYGETICEFDTMPFDYDEVDVFDEDDWDFTISNEGDLPFSGVIDLQDASGMFSCALDGHAYTLQPFEELDVNVVFHPTEVGEFSCTLDAGIECGSVVVSGTGTMEPGICDFDTEPYEFFETELSNCDEDEFTIWNEGAGTLTGVIAFEDPDGAFHCDLAGQPYSIGAFEYLDVVGLVGAIAASIVGNIAIMAHLRRELDLPILEVRYEELVADPEPGIRRMLDHIGLPFDERCLAFHESDRAIHTASLDQVRRPIYKTSTQRWRRYGQGTRPLIDALARHGVIEDEAG